jgi:predicted transcriptional regulator
MAKKPKRKPSEAELDILQVLWEKGPCPVRVVYEELAPRRKTGYTTILKLMQIMLEKGLVERNDQRKAHIYSAAVSKEKTEQMLVKDILQRGFRGNLEAMMVRAMEAKRVPDDQMAEIQRILNKGDKK